MKEIAKQYRRRVSSCYLFDSIVCKSPRDPNCSWKVLELPGDIFRHKLSITLEGHKVRLHASGYFIAATMEDIDVDVCSINRRDWICRSRPTSFPIPEFPSLSLFSEEPALRLLNSSNSEVFGLTLRNLQLTTQESLHFYSNAINLYLCRDSKEQVLAAIAAVGRLAEVLRVDEVSPDLSELPREFEKLFALIPKWALSDDEERSELIKDASMRTLKSFVATVDPYIPAINEYLDSFGGKAPPEAATMLGTLAEYCLEAQIQLQNRNG